MTLHHYDLIVINTSGGKDSVCAIIEVLQLTQEQGWRGPVHLSHQDLGDMEWAGVSELVWRQASHFNLPLTVSTRIKDGIQDSILAYVLRRGKWPSNKQRWCTSDFKRAPGQKVLRQLAAQHGAKSVLNVFGFRAQESSSRAKRSVLSPNKALTTRSRKVYDYLPIHGWDLKNVWATIRAHNVPMHQAYALGMPRLSCQFCIFAPKEALLIAGLNDPAKLNRYIEVEKATGHTFRNGFSLMSILDSINAGAVPVPVPDWNM